MIALTACTSGSSASTESVAGANAMATNAAAAAPERDATAGQGAAAGSSNSSATDSGASATDGGTLTGNQLAAAPVDGSKIIRTADLSVKIVVEPVAASADESADRQANATARAAAVAQAATTARTAATTAGGFQSSADGGGSATNLTLRVPADQYDAVVEKLAALGDVTNRTETSQDVTAEVVDVNSRVESMTASVARVRALLAAATDIADVISIESELAAREANLESLQQQQAALSGQVALSTVSLTLTAVTRDATTTEPVTSDSGFLAGLTSGWSALLGFLGGLAGVLGAVLPFLPLIAGGALLIWWVIRRARRRSRPATGPTGGPAATPAVAEQDAPVGAGVG